MIALSQVGDKKGLSTPSNVRAFQAPVRVANPEVSDRPESRRFTAEYKARIIEELDHCPHGEIGALLRREGIYSSTVSKWRKQQDRAIQRGLELQRVRRAATPDPSATRVAELERENAFLKQRLKQAEAINEVQKKISEILSIPLNPPPSDESD